VALQSEIDSTREIEKIIQEAETARKVVSFGAAKMKAKPDQIRKNRKEEADRIRRGKEKAAPEPTPEKSTPIRGEAFGYDDIFAQFADEEDDE
jgi:hypothetical protein